ncbi:four helix bundle protein [Candidatus Microgenomates bacterium]|nr:four helix bundle protein [Candidatus Microgenomates bacterium]
MKKYLKLEDITAYKIASELSDIVYEIVSKWKWFDKRTLGAQFVSAIDSIAANIAEGFGRYHKKDKIKFYYNSRASVFESAHWAKKADKRKLVAKTESDKILNLLRKLPKEINNLISLTNKYLEK